MDARSDQFSFAAALWEALCGEFPYPIESVDPRDRATIRPPRSDTGLPDALFECLRRALQPEPHRRFPAMSDLVARLRQLQNELRLTKPVASAAAPASPAAATVTTTIHTRRSWALLVFPTITAAIVAGVLAQLGLWAGDDSDTADEPDTTNSQYIDPPETVPIPIPTPPPPLPASPVISASACAGQFSGQWTFDTTATRASKDSLRDKTGHYELTLRPDDNICSFTATLRKLGVNKSIYKVPLKAPPETVKIDPTTGHLEQRFIITKFTYDLSLRLTSDGIKGSYQATGTDSERFSGPIKGARKKLSLP